MKRSFANIPKSSRIVGFENKIIKKEGIGYISYIFIDRVRNPVVKVLGDHYLKLADKGYIWIQVFNREKNHCITTMFDEEGNIVEWYIDIVKNIGIDSEGIPYYDDLYLDVVVVPNGEIFLLDLDELEEAYRKKQVDKEDYILAKEEVELILDTVVDNMDRLKKESISYLSYL